MKKQLFFWLFVSAISITILENMVASVRETKVWEPAREPETREAAEKLEKDSKIKEQEAQKKLEEAQKANDVEEIKNEEIKLSEAKYDLDTAQKKIRYETLLNDPKSTPEERNKAKEELETKKKEIEKKIQAIEAALKQGGTDINAGSKTFNQYEENFTTKFNTLNEKQKIEQLKKEIDAFTLGSNSSVMNDFGRNVDYASRKKILEFLEKNLNPYVKNGGSEISNLMNTIVETLDEIDKLPKTIISDNAIAKEYNLAEKINVDQIPILRKLLLKPVFEKMYPTSKERLKALNEIKKITLEYDIYDNVIESRFYENSQRPEIIEEKLKQVKQDQSEFAASAKILDDFFMRAKKEPYTAQTQTLEKLAKEYEALISKANRSSSLDNSQKAELKRKYDDLLQHEQEITNFLKNPRQFTNQNDFEKRLNLADKIPDDQIRILMDQFELLGFKEIKDFTKDDIAILKQFRDAMEHFKLNSSYKAEYDMIDSLIKNAEPKPVALPEGLTKEDVAVTSVLGEIGQEIIAPAKDEKTWLQNIKDFFVKDGIIFVKNVANIIAYPPRKLAEGITYVIRESGKFLQRKFAAPDFINKMAAAPEMFEGVMTQLTDLGEAGGGTVKAVLRADIAIQQALLMAIGQKEVADKLGEFANNFQENLKREEVEKIRNIVKNIGTVGRTLKSIIEFPKYIGEKLESLVRTKKEADLLRSFDEAKRLIESERANIKLAKREKGKEIPGVAEIGSLLVKFGKYFSDLIIDSNKQLEVAQSNYDKARSEYLISLGVDANATPEVIARRIEANKNNKTFIAKTENLAQAVSDLNQEFRVLVDKLESIGSNLEFVVDFWDEIKVTKDGENADLPTLIKGIFDVRDMKLAYLEAIRNGINQMESDATKFQGSPASGLADASVYTFQRMIDGKIFETIQQYADVAKQIDKMIEGQKVYLESRLPQVPDETPSSGGQTGGDSSGPKPAEDGGEGDGTYDS